MSSLMTAISVQISKKDKEEATAILQKLGVSMSGLINMTIRQLIMRGKIPFDVSLPSDELHQYFSQEELDNAAKEIVDMEIHPEKYKGYKDTGELKEALLSDE